MNAFLADPIVQTAALPLLLSLVAVGLLAVVARRLAVAGVGVAFVLAYLTIVGVPAFPPPSSMGKLFWTAGAGVALGIGADLAGLSARRAALVLGGWLAASLGWLVAPVISGIGGVASLALLGVAAAMALARGGDEGRGAAAPAAMLLSWALAVGGTALIGASASVAQLAMALAAAAGGLLLWNWPVQRHVWGAAGQAGFGIVVLLAAMLVFFTNARAEVLLAALPALFADRLVRLLPVSATRGAFATVVLSVIAVTPALVAISLAFALSGGEASGY